MRAKGESGEIASNESLKEARRRLERAREDVAAWEAKGWKKRRFLVAPFVCLALSIPASFVGGGFYNYELSVYAGSMASLAQHAFNLLGIVLIVVFGMKLRRWTDAPFESVDPAPYEQKQRRLERELEALELGEAACEGLRAPTKNRL